MENIVGIISHFKGDVPSIIDLKKKRLCESVISGIDPATGLQLSREQYIENLQQVKKAQREIAENVARVFAASLHGMRRYLQGDDVQPLFLEGCTWDWGTTVRTGAEISHDIYDLVPETMRLSLQEPYVEALTKRTRDEFEHVLRIADERGLDAVTTVTHSYHQYRTSMIGEFMKRKGDYPQELEVRTPMDIANEWERIYDAKPDERFLIDAIRIAEPSRATHIKEGVKEKGPLL